MNLSHPRMIGFGISNQSTFRMACDYASGAIVGSLFIKYLASGRRLVPPWRLLASLGR